MKKISRCILAIIMILSFNLTVFATGDVETGFVPDTKKELTAEAVYLKNLETGDIIYTKNLDRKIYPASLTKMMTVILAFENTPDINNTMVKYPIEVQDYLYKYSLEHGSLSTGGLVANEERSMKEYIYAAMLPSANEAAMSMGIHLGGDIDSFVDMMNKRAQELGMKNTSFANTTGLFDENNYTTVEDLAILTEHAFTIEGFMDIANTYRYEAGPSNMQESLTWTSTIELQNPELRPGELYYYEGIKGVKTGTLPEAGHNYISTIEKDGYHYMLIVTGATPIADRAAFLETKDIYDWVFTGLRNQTLVGENEVVGEIPVNFGKEVDFVQLKTSEHFTILIPDSIILAGDGAQVELIYDIPDNIDSPVKKDDYIGDYVVKLLGEEVGRVPLVAKADVSYSATKKMMHNIENAGIKFWIKIIAVVVVIFIVIIIIRGLVRLSNKRKRNRAFKRKSNYKRK